MTSRADEGSEHVVMRVAAGSSALDRSMHSLWTGSHLTPSLDASAPANLVSYDVFVDSVFKSPIVDCAWSHVEEVGSEG